MGSGKNILELIPNSEILWLAQQGDFLVHFMDIAWDELSKKPDEISVEKLQVWLSLLHIRPCIFGPWINQ